MKTALITGASRGIGEAIATALAAEHHNLILNCCHSAQELHTLAARLTSEYHIDCLECVGDVADADFVTSMFAEAATRFGGVDILVNNAGISHIGLLSDMTLSEWNHVINTNLTSVFSCCKEAIPHMVQQQSGRIINISSVWGSVGASCEVAYSASKGAINSLTMGLAKELAPSNIQVNAIACGIIDTQMNACFTEEERHSLEDEIPAGRYGQPSEVGDLVAYLTKSSSYLTGQIIRLDGGWI